MFIFYYEPVQAGQTNPVVPPVVSPSPPPAPLTVLETIPYGLPTQPLTGEAVPYGVPNLPVANIEQIPYSLPKTADAYNFAFLVMGIILTDLGALLWINRKKIFKVYNPF